MPWYANNLLVAAESAAPGAVHIPVFVYLLVVLAVFVIPCVLGYYLSRLWRMPDYGAKIGLVLFTTIAGLVISVFGWPPRLGIDLRGGVILVYEVQESAMEKVKQTEEGDLPTKGKAPSAQQQSVDMDKLISAVGKRINPGGVREITIRPYGARQVEIIVPEADEAEARSMKDKISKIGTLEFRILATTHNPKYRNYIERAKKLPDNKLELKDDEGNLLAKWVPVTKGREEDFDKQSQSDIATRTVKRGGKDTLEVLVVKDNYDVTGDYLSRAAAGEDAGRPVVKFMFNNTGAAKFGRLTSSHKPDEVQNFKYYLGIILDGYLYSAPYIKDAIFEQGVISGSFTPKAVQDQVDVFNAGSLPAALSREPISETFTGPTLGSDTIRMGTDSMALSMLIICVFMLIYYRFSGIVACLALAANMVLLLACMIAVKAAFSLPGLAGFALTIGMAVDSNVLIYERIREEMDRGAALRMAIRNGFDRAFSAIFDSHLTTLISAAVLYSIGQEQVKGFAITLFLGVAINLYTAVFCVHVVFDVAERQKWIKRLKMMRMLTKTDIDFWGLRFRCFALSIGITVIGLIAVFARGRSLLNIDFTGGVSVQVMFDQKQDIEAVRTKLESLPDFRERDLAVSDVIVKGGEIGYGFMINTSSPEGMDGAEYMKIVQAKLRDVFAGQLTTNAMTVRDVQPIAAAPKAAVPATKPPGEPAEKALPAPKTQSRNDLPSSTLLASTDPSAVLLALADPAAKGSPPPAAPAAKAAEKPVAEKPAPKPPEKAAPPDAKTPPASTPAPLAPVTPAAPPAATPPSGGADRFAGGTQATLEFSHELRSEAVEQLIRGQLTSRGLPANTIDLEVSNKDSTEEAPVALKSWDVKISLPKQQAEPIFTAVKEELRNSPFFPSSNTIGGSVAGSTRLQAVYAIIVSNVLIMIYLWVRFQRLSYGVAAVVALIHDVLVALGFLAVSYYIAPVLNSIGLRFLLLEPFKIGMTEVAAFLTIVGYSVSDTVVVFDRIREVRGKFPDVTPRIINVSINQTLSRTILTSLTAWIVVVVLYFLGGPTIHGFAFAMIIGILTGTYSSIYVAAPLLLVGKKHAPLPGTEGPKESSGRMTPAR